MFEHRHEPLLPLRRFVPRMAKSFGVAVTIDLVSLAIGGIGFRSFEPLTWTDAFLNAALVLSGNGPIARMQTAGGQAFLLLYAILGVVIFAAVISVVLAPVLHRLLHSLHADVPETGSPFR
jgi:hypothetical protein